MSERIDDLLHSWTIELEAADKAPRTIVLYAESVRAFTTWLGEQARPPMVDELTKHAIARWLADLRERGMSSNTLISRHKQLHRFIRWLIAEGELEADPMANLELPVAKPKAVPILTDHEVSALFKVTEGTTFDDRRDHAILRMLFDCGLRINEIASLGEDAVDLKAMQLYVMGKGRKPRLVPFGAKTARALDRYRRQRREHRHAHESAFFLSQRGPLSKDGIDDMLRRRARQAGVDNLHAHRFRHTFAHRWLSAGGEGRDLMKIAGWSSDTMLDHYGSSAADERARDAFRRLKLGDKL
jgi:site-specific recombinase XerD